LRDQTAAQAAELSNVSSNSINDLFYKLRLRIVALSVADTPELGELEVDESYFGARRVRGRRGRGAAGKTPVFGILKREGKVYVNIVKNCSREQLLL